MARVTIPLAIGVPNGAAQLDSSGRLVAAEVPLSVVSSSSIGYLSLRNDFALNPSMSVGSLTTSIQNAITSAISAGKGLDLGADLWPINAPLTIGGDLAIRASGAQELMGTRLNSAGGAFPSVSPFVQGGGFVQQQSAADILQITGTGAVVHLDSMLLRFADSIAFSNTGHAVNGTPTATDGTGHELGPSRCQWRNLIVFGHDGNHYAYYTVNAVGLMCSHLRSYGGGFWYQGCDSQYTSTGNSLMENLDGAMVVGGSADLFHLASRTSTFPGALNLNTFMRPNAAFLDISSGSLQGIAYPVLVSNHVGSGQYLWRDSGNSLWTTLIDADLEDDRSSPVNPNIQLGNYTTLINPAFLGEQNLKAANFGFAAWSADINPAMTPAASTGTWNWHGVTGDINGGVVQNDSNALNDAIAWDRQLSPGTWEVEIAHHAGNTYGICSIQLDGVTVATQDHYSASGLLNVITTSSFTVPGPAGKHRLNFAALSKNASSTGYTFALQWITLRRTA